MSTAAALRGSFLSLDVREREDPQGVGVLAYARAAVPSSVALQGGLASWSLAAQGFSLFLLQKQNKQVQGTEAGQ